jgi:ribose/xylose/arabinose/galactoside ABC-type transport system permease subunit
MGDQATMQVRALLMQTVRRSGNWTALLKLPSLPALAIAFVIFAFSLDEFASAANLDNMARLFAPLVIVAVGLTFVFLLGEIDLSIGSVLSLASVLGAFAMRDTGSVWLGAVVTVAVGALIGAFNGAVIAFLRFSPFVHTLGMLVIARAIAMLITQGHSVGRLPSAALSFGRGNIAGLPTLLWLAVTVCIVAHVILRHTVAGREFFLIGANRRASVFVGLHTRRARFLAFLISGTLAGLAGVCVLLRLGSGGPALGDNVLLMAIAAVVFGGTKVFGADGSVFRTATGALAVVILDKGLNMLGLAFYDQAVVMGLVIVFGSALGEYLYRWQTARS